MKQVLHRATAFTSTSGLTPLSYIARAIALLAIIVHPMAQASRFNWEMNNVESGFSRFGRPPSEAKALSAR